MTAGLKPGQTVWLVAKTLTAPAVCFKSLSGVVTDVDTTSLYVIVNVPDHGAHRIHIDNIARRDPNAGRRPGRTYRRARALRHVAGRLFRGDVVVTSRLLSLIHVAVISSDVHVSGGGL